MIHYMKLFESPFERTKKGKKLYEIRLYDEKRKLLSLDDIIEFSKFPFLEEKLQVKVTELIKYNNFKELIDDIGTKPFGYSRFYSKKKFLNSCYNIYHESEEKKHGVLAIGMKLI